MEELERFEKLKKLGYMYEPETGVVKRNGNLVGYKNPQGYIILRYKNYRVYSHRYIWWLIHKELPLEIDHINHITDDNKINNLRNITHQENLFNTNAKGFYFNKNRNKYQANIKLNGKVIYLGLYNTEQEARQAYLDAKAIYHKI